MIKYAQLFTFFVLTLFSLCARAMESDRNLSEEEQKKEIIQKKVNDLYYDVCRFRDPCVQNGEGLTYLHYLAAGYSVTQKDHITVNEQIKTWCTLWSENISIDAFINIKDSQLRTPLDIAILSKNYTCIETLVVLRAKTSANHIITEKFVCLNANELNTLISKNKLDPNYASVVRDIDNLCKKYNENHTREELSEFINTLYANGLTPLDMALIAKRKWVAAIIRYWGGKTFKDLKLGTTHSST